MERKMFEPLPDAKFFSAHKDPVQIEARQTEMSTFVLESYLKQVHDAEVWFREPNPTQGGHCSPVEMSLRILEPEERK